MFERRFGFCDYCGQRGWLTYCRGCGRWHCGSAACIARAAAAAAARAGVAVRRM